MQDKQIIINGVDVSECSYYQHNMCTATKDDYGDCSLCCQDYDMNDCYYKQLKRKEQECNSYKQTLREIQQDLEYATYCESQECGCDDLNECLECTKNQIIQKISECEVTND